MIIKINTEAAIQNYEGVFELSLGRKRKDIQQLLEHISSGKSLKDLFLNDIIANNVKNFLRNKEYLNNDGNITANGKKFLSYPYLPEKEEGLYSIDVSSVCIQNNSFSFVTKIRRILSPEERKPGSMESELWTGNEFLLGNDECAIYDKHTLKSGEVFVSEAKSADISLDFLQKNYTLDHQTFALSDEMVNYLKEQLAYQLKDDDILFDNKDLSIIVNSLTNIPERDLLDGTLSKYEKNGFLLLDIPLKINSKSIATKYIYFYLYHLLMDNNFYSISEMNEIVQNEILTRVISESVRHDFYDFVVTEDGFREHLSISQYEKLQYRLNIVKELLGVDMIPNGNNLLGFKNYDQLIQVFDRKFGNHNVSTVYLVMGYAFAKIESNDFLKCAREFVSNYDYVYLVNKKNSTSYKSDPNIEQEVKNLGVTIVNNPDISKYFHDRYLIFKMSNGTYKVFMCSCEIGQFFNPDTGEAKGFIYEIPQTALVKKSGSLLNMLGANND